MSETRAYMVDREGECLFDIYLVYWEASSIWIS